MSISPELAVIVPVLDEAAQLEARLAELERLPPWCELIVVDGGSSDGSEAIARRFGRVHWLRAPRGRAHQMNAGAARARARNLLFLHADTILPPDAPRLVLDALDDERVVAGSFRLSFDAPGALLSLYAWCSRFNLRVTTFGDQGLFLRRGTFEAVGGFAAVPLMEDVEIQGRLRRLGRFRKLAVPVCTSARRFRRHGPLRQQLRNVALVTAFLCGVSPERLARLYAPHRSVPAEAPEARAWSRGAQTARKSTMARCASLMRSRGVTSAARRVWRHGRDSSSQ